MKILNVGCGGRPLDKACYFGDVRVDIVCFPTITIRADAHFLPFKNSTFDRIVCFETLEHLISPYKALKEFRRVLKDHGDIFISVPNVWYFRRNLEFLIKKHKVFSDTPSTDHKQAWDVFDFMNLAYQAGLKVKDVKFFNWYPTARRKLWILDVLLKFIPQIGFSDVMFRLEPSYTKMLHR